MTITTYAIATEHGTQQKKGVKVNDYFANDFRRASFAPVYNNGTLASGFCVTHLPTGRYIQGFYNPKHAIACCKMLVRVWDYWGFRYWEEINEQIRGEIHRLVAKLSYMDQVEKYG
jgi:hypothetical protein